MKLEKYHYCSCSIEHQEEVSKEEVETEIDLQLLKQDQT
jgi:hypothetical protein